MDTKKLRQKILDLAIRGKLVPQDPNDEPASVLLERIREEKERLIKEGKIKRSKKTTSDDEIEAPFEIPESWEWVRLEEFVMAVTDGDHQPPPQSVTGVPFLVISDVNKGTIDFGHARFVSEEYYNSLPAIRKALKGDILFTVTGSYGIPILVETERKFCFQRHIGLIKTISCSEWITNYLQSAYTHNYCDKVATGTAQKTVSLGHLRDLTIPIPPLEEQQRIVNEVEHWLSVIDELESNEGDLLKAIDQAKSKILDLAIHGKLVPQDPNDESASETLREIYEEKAKLVKDGKLKKKNLVETPIDANEFPFMIPENWEWARMNYFVQFINGDRGKNYPSKDKLLYEGDFPFISAVNITDNGVSRDGLLYLSKQQFHALSQGKLNKGDIVLCIRGSLGKTAIYPFDKGAVASSLVILRNICNTYNKYVLCFLKTSLFNSQVNSCDNGTAQPNLSADNVANFLVPFPPLNEQKRIVNKIEELFAVLDSIKESLE